MLKKIFSTKINVAANFISSIWIGFLSIIFVPLYLPYIGIEAYGLIGIFMSVQAFINLLDFGLSPTINVELAKLSALKDQSQEMHNLKRTLEVVNWFLAIFIALSLCALTPLIARLWIQPNNLSVETITQAFIIMSVNIAIQFSANLYAGGLMGLQKQVSLNVINIVCGTLRSVGAFVVLIYFSPTIQAFLLWQGLIALLQGIMFAVTLKFSLPNASTKGRFQKELLYKIGSFATGMTGIGIGSLILSQTDKVILSRMLTLETFGYYMLAVTISSMAMSMLVGSITHAVYPRFSQFVSTGDENQLREFYHLSCQTVSAFLFPVTIVFALFSYDILLVWTGKEEIAVNTYSLLSLIAIGTGFNSLLWLPYSLQFAHSWTKLLFYLNIVMIFTVVPLMIAGVYKYGAIGGATAWIVLNAAYLVVAVQFMHRKILKGELLRWYLEDLAMPFIAALLAAVIGKILLTSNGTKTETFVGLIAVSIFTFSAAALSTKAMRNHLKNIIKYIHNFNVEQSRK